jgi:radical SAM superfamily enzyme YgiQ (UPF0313 family)
LFWGNRVRYKSAERLLREMHGLAAATGRNFFALIGDNLAASPQRLMAICERLIKEAPGYEWDCSLALDRLQRQDLDVLWAAGCRSVFVGLESSSRETLRRIGKNLDLRRTLDLVAAAVDKGFSIKTSLIVGFPWETRSDVEATYNLHAELLRKGAHSRLTALCPLPGTALESTEIVHQTGGQSATAIDRIPHGPRAREVIQRCPELFTQLGCFETKNLERVQLRTTLQAASILNAHYSQRSRASRPDARM